MLNIPDNFPITAATLRQLDVREKTIRCLAQARLIPVNYGNFKGFVGTLMTRIQEKLRMSLAPSYADEPILFNAGILKISPLHYVYDRTLHDEEFDILRPEWGFKVAFVEEMRAQDIRVSLGHRIYIHEDYGTPRKPGNFTNGFGEAEKRYRDLRNDSITYTADGETRSNHRCTYTRLENFGGHWYPTEMASPDSSRNVQFVRDLDGRIIRRVNSTTSWTYIWHRGNHVGSLSVASGWKYSIPRHTLVDHPGPTYAEIPETAQLDQMADGTTIRRVRDIVGLGTCIQTARRDGDKFHEKLEGPGIVMDIITTSAAYQFFFRAVADGEAVEKAITAFTNIGRRRGDNRRRFINNVELV